MVEASREENDRLTGFSASWWGQEVGWRVLPVSTRGRGQDASLLSRKRVWNQLTVSTVALVMSVPKDKPSVVLQLK